MADQLPAVIRTERGLMIAGTRITLYDMMDYVTAQYPFKENTSTSLPIVTIGDADRVLSDPDYRNRCVDRLIEIVFDIDESRGAMRLLVPG